MRQVTALEYERERTLKEESKFDTEVVTLVDCKLFADRDLASESLALVAQG